MGRLRLAAACAAALALAPAASTAAPQGSWALPQIRALVEAGVVAGPPASFRASDPLTAGELEALVAAVAEREPAAVARPDAPVTLAALNRRFVHALGLKDSAYRFNLAARRAGLRPPSRFGAEVVARLLGLRYNHPAGTDELEPLPSTHVSRAEAAYSAARALELDEHAVERVRELALGFELPALEGLRRELLRTAVSLVGHPYVWAGTEGGFDCSGFVWRVVKLQPYAGAESLAATLRGRTSFAMSGEVPRGARIAREALEPADVLFFGARGPKSKPKQVDHMGLYLGNGWMVHSSRDGVTVVPVEGWWAEQLAWARRPLAEAGF